MEASKRGGFKTPARKDNDTNMFTPYKLYNIHFAATTLDFPCTD